MAGRNIVDKEFVSPNSPNTAVKTPAKRMESRKKDDPCQRSHIVSLPATLSSNDAVKSDNPVIFQWLKELRASTEPECIHVIQTKTILKDDSVQTCISELPSCSLSLPNLSTASKESLVHLSPCSPQEIQTVSSHMKSIRYSQETADMISASYSKICGLLEICEFSHVPVLAMHLAQQIQEFLYSSENACFLPHNKHCDDLLSTSASMTDNLQNTERLLEDACFELVAVAEEIIQKTSCSFSTKKDDQHLHLTAEMVKGLVLIGNQFSEVMDLRVGTNLMGLLDAISGGGAPGRVAVKLLCNILEESGPYIRQIAADNKFVFGLLDVAGVLKDDQEKIFVLRCLATLLGVQEAVKDFDEADGFGMITDILNDPSASFPLKLEAVASLVQSTDPWIDPDATLINLGFHIEKLIFSLTNLMTVMPNFNEESFIMITAALSNLTFLDPSSIKYLSQYHTASILLSIIQSQSLSVSLSEHVVTILANMTAEKFCRQEIISSGGVDFLLHFLHLRIFTSCSSNKIYDCSDMFTSVCEKIQRNSIIALSRLTNEDGVASYLIERKVLHRLIVLCRQEKERNYSDGVLMAALVAFRKLASLCRPDEIKELTTAEDLLHPSLLNSFLQFSSQQESYV